MRRVQVDEGFWDDIGVITRFELKKWYEDSRSRAFDPPYNGRSL